MADYEKQAKFDANQQGHELEERMLREASRLRKEAQQLREERLKARQEEAEAEERDQEYRKRQEERRKVARDEQIRALLLPLSKDFQMTGWRIKPPPFKPDAPVFILTRSNHYPAEDVKIYWQEGSLFGNNRGFHWE